MGLGDQNPPRRLPKGLFRAALVLAFVLVVSWVGLAHLYSLSPTAFAEQAARVIAAPLLAEIYRDDLKHVDNVTRRYWVGYFDASGRPPVETWTEIARQTSGMVLVDADTAQQARKRIPFVYESAGAEYLRAFRSKYRLDDIIAGASDEYGAMLRLGNWMGTRWDHGLDQVPGCNVAAVVESGEHGAKYWCEIAAHTTVQAATSLSWPARLITASRDGYSWEHAVAELWSNQFDKWFVLDTDFNVVFERRGIPLSALELSEYGEEWEKNRELAVRAIAPAKASLPLIDLVPFFKYIHVDLRNDWCSRLLRPGSPAGGDRNTWWTARSTLPRILTAKIRVNDPSSFDWKINSVGIYAASAVRMNAEALVVKIRLGVYSPVFEEFQVKVDGGPWQRVTGYEHELSVMPGEHIIRARIQTRSGFPGSESQVVFKF
jgi:hypothetical protein